MADTAALAPMPEWWAKTQFHLFETPQPNGHRIGLDRAVIERGVPKGERDVSIFKLACSLRGHDIEYGEALKVVLAAAAKCSPPFPIAEAELKLKQAWRYPAGKRLRVVFGTPPAYTLPLASDDVLPFPLYVFPDTIQRLVNEGVASITCPPDFIGVTFLIALGTAIGTSRVLKLKSGYTEGARLFAAIVGKPGSRKSPAIKLALKGIFNKQAEASKSYERDEAAFRAARDDWEIKTKEWEQRKANHAKHTEVSVGERPVEPIPPKFVDYFGTDFTMEALGVMLDRNRRGLVAYHDELTAWVRGQNQYRNGKGTDKEHWLALWNGAPLKIDRKSAAKTLFIPSPFVAVIGGLQPDVLSVFKDEQGAEDGFIHRILFSFPNSSKQRWTPDGVSDQALAAYCKVFEDIWATLQPTSDDEPREVFFTPDGYAMWEEWNRDHEAEIEDGFFPLKLYGPWAKFTSHCPRVALILHELRYICGDAESEHVDEISVRGAAELMDYFKSHARRVYQYLSEDKEDKQATEIAEWIRDHGREVTEREVLMHKVAGVKKASDVKRIFRDLEDRRFGVREQIGGAAGFIFGKSRGLDENGEKC